MGTSTMWMDAVVTLVAAGGLAMAVVTVRRRAACVRFQRELRRAVLHPVRRSAAASSSGTLGRHLRVVTPVPNQQRGAA